MQVEQSQMSRSQSEIASNAFRRQLVLGQSSKMDLIFPLVDNLAQHTKLPFILTTLVTVYFYLQVIYTSLWPVSAFWDGAGQIGDILDIFREIFWFIGTRPPQSRLLIVLLVLAALFVISFGIILIALYRFKTAHRFETWLLYCARIVLEVIAPVLFHPAAALTGSSIQRLDKFMAKHMTEETEKSDQIFPFMLIEHLIQNSTNIHIAQPTSFAWL